MPRNENIKKFVTESERVASGKNYQETSIKRSFECKKRGVKTAWRKLTKKNIKRRKKVNRKSQATTSANIAIEERGAVFVFFFQLGFLVGFFL